MKRVSFLTWIYIKEDPPHFNWVFSFFRHDEKHLIFIGLIFKNTFHNLYIAKKEVDWAQYHTCPLWNTYIFCYIFHLCVKLVRWNWLFLMVPFSCFLHAWKFFEIKCVLGWKEASCPLRQWIFCGTVKTVLKKQKFCWAVKKTRSIGRWNPDFSQRVLTQRIAAVANTVESTTA